MTLPTVDDIAELVRLVGRRADIYLRYSRGPDADAVRSSRDYEADLDLPGLSVTPLSPPSWWARPAVDWVARQICKYIDIAEQTEDRRPWVLAGQEVSRGPDHEPIVADVEPLAWLGDDVLAAATELYRERFDVGRSSTGGDGGSRESA